MLSQSGNDLTGAYAHRHGIVDNNTPIPAGTRFFPKLLQQAGYRTAFIGKWHMGHDGDDPQPGFDHWVSFRGQGSYKPSRDGLNVNGQRVPQRRYITDELTGYAEEWLTTVPRETPFFLYLSHKAVHSGFVPAERHLNLYAKETFTPPKTMAATGQFAQHRPVWVRTNATAFSERSSPIRQASTSASTINATPRRCSAWTRAWAACSKLSSGAGNWIRPWSSIWATTVLRSASTV